MVEANGEILSVGRKTRSIPPALRRALRSRDHGGCRWPGCTNARFTDGHHVEHWARGGETKLTNLVTLCRRHHRVVHDGGFAVETHVDGHFTFHHPDGSLIPEVVGAPSLGGSSLQERNAAEGLSIDDQTCRPNWDGDPLTSAGIDEVLGAHGEFTLRAAGHDPPAPHKDGHDPPGS
jgi:hypothetical protein